MPPSPSSRLASTSESTNLSPQVGSSSSAGILPGRMFGVTDIDVLIVGAGFGGLYALHTHRQQGFRVLAVEAGADVGGTWYWNRYPGCRCDVESIDYSYSFDPDLEQEWEWSERYAAQPEILAYLNHVADRFDLRRDIVFETRVTPAYPGVETYTGRWYHTARWPSEGVDFTGQRVGVNGTGSSAIQAIPLIAEQAAQLVVFQRTPNFSVPAHNHRLDPDALRDLKARYPEYRQQNRLSFLGTNLQPADKGAAAYTEEERRAALESRWARGGLAVVGAFADTMFDRSANEIVADFVRSKIHETVRDPAVAEALSPKGYAIGSKRVCVDTGYYATYNRDNVRLVDLTATPIEGFTPTGLRTADENFTFD